MKRKNRKLFKKLVRENQVLTVANENLTEKLNIVSACLAQSVLNSFLNAITPEKMPEVKNVVFKEPETIVYFEDGTNTVAKCNTNVDTFSKETGLLVALTKRAYGKDMYNYINKYCK